MIFRWLLERRRGGPPAWAARGNAPADSRDARCGSCGVPRQAHTREFHEFVPPTKSPPPGS